MLTELRGGRLTTDINVVPMIDVLLVLLIIFMLLQPNRQVMPVQVPAANDVTAASDTPIVLDIDELGRYRLNDGEVSAAMLGDSLRTVFADRPHKVLFVRAARNRRYQEVLTAMDVVRGAGIDVLGWMPNVVASKVTATAQ